MPQTIEFPFNQLSSSDLIVDALYRSGVKGNAGDDPISKLVGCGNQGGFRFRGELEKPKLCILYSDMVQPDWPDMIILETGQFIYYGDNRQPGSDLHRPRGNQILRNVFNNLHADNRITTPPFLIFTKGPEKRDVIFRGLGVPGFAGVNQTEDLVAIWKTISGERFQNYRAIFTILNIDKISRSWINDISNGNTLSQNAPTVWSDWITKRKYTPLIAPKTKKYRNKQEQVPIKGLEKEIIDLIITLFKNHQRKEYAFESCAAEIVKMMDSNVADVNITRPWRDGGRDALGSYKIGTGNSYILVDFALEAKCHSLTNASGVKETSRLISRLRYRQFGIFVTTSYLDTQAYKEIIEDEHPIIVISAVDISQILIRSGYKTIDEVADWLKSSFP